MAMSWNENTARDLGSSGSVDDCAQGADQAAAELAQANASLQRRENLLQASAKASRQLLEAVDVMSAMPNVMRVLGEAANVDRICLMMAQTGSNGEALLRVTSEWVADGVDSYLGHPVMGCHDVSAQIETCSQLRAGRSICMYKDPVSGEMSPTLQSGTKTKAIVPIFLDNEYVGVVAFDNTRQRRNIDAAELAALETAAGVIGAALHRERLVDAVRREREQAAEERVNALAERNRIAQEIHDGLAQAFTGILMQLGAAEELETTAKQPTLSVVLKRIRDIAKEGLTEARRSVLTIRPDQTRRDGLVIALRQLADRSSVPSRIACNFEGSESVTGLPPEHEHELLRIAQEAVSNSLRHAQPSNVTISMAEAPAHWELAVTDDGCGMDAHPEFYSQQGFGLSNMRERAGAIGGEWQIATSPGQGTRVSVRLPKRTLQ